MHEVEARFYLPISEEQIQRVQQADSAHESLSTLDLPQWASLLLLQKIPDLSGQESRGHEWLLADQLAALNRVATSEAADGLKNAIANTLDRDRLKAGQALLGAFGIALLDDESVKQRHYLNVDQSWNFEFAEQHREKLRQRSIRIDTQNRSYFLTREQMRRYTEIHHLPGESIHIQGYAGCGKTLMIRQLAAGLAENNARPLVLCHTQAQSRALQTILKDCPQVDILTVGGLAYRMIPVDRTAPTFSALRRGNPHGHAISTTELVNLLGIPSSGRYPEWEIATLARQSVFNFCHSTDSEISSKHLPRHSSIAHNEDSAALVVENARLLWQLTIAPHGKGRALPIHAYHRIKYAALQGWQVMPQYTDILMDEAHEFSPALLQLLENSPQALISLGDEFQRIRGMALKRDNVIRQREMTHSVRSSRNVEAIINPLIQAHPSRLKEPFIGNTLGHTRISYYRTASIPDKPSAILVPDWLAMVAWLKRLADAGAGAQLLDNHRDLHNLGNDLIGLYRENIRPRHPEFRECSAWDSLARRHHSNPAFMALNRILEEGYNYADWSADMARVTDGERPRFTLGRLESARNHEFRRVMVSDEWLAEIRHRDPAPSPHVLAHLYIATTRATEELILPMTMQEWIEAISGS
ncbi:hypothetical protein VCB98_11865 [Gammaproteobacteria bacterium AB-CW1]|uniref:Uncharacterized protein n=1 Tax=Natronospira elongata TaxID=3110268 RepID=A0AAP6JJA2_9GAMM|nr:hypothetical protein [Gammaproteobacteria bacterium AB-CW1]